MTAEVLRARLPQPTRSCRRRVWIWDVGVWVLTDDVLVWRLAYLRPAGGAR